MRALTRRDLYSLETYAQERGAFRERVLAHKKTRRLPVGPNATLYFEDRLTIQYQIQEMLRIERIFERRAIEEELSAYNPLIPDGGNLKATFMLEYTDEHERRRQLQALAGIERTVWLAVPGFGRSQAIADEDMEREREEKTSAVHFLRFEFPEDARVALRSGATLQAGIDHPRYACALDVPEAIRTSLANDLT